MAKNKNGPPVEKPKPIEIVSVKRTRRTIDISWKQGDASFDLSERDNPLPDFSTAMDALAPIVAVICHLPKAYGESGLRVVGFKMGEQSGADTVSLHVRKDIDDAAKEFAFTTPARLLQHPTTPGKYTPPLAQDDADLVRDAIEQAKLYVQGHRAQGQIAFETDDGEGDDGSGEEDPKQGELIPMAPGATGKPVTAKKP